MTYTNRLSSFAFTKTLLAASVALLAQATAHAGAYSTATIGDLTFTVISLDPSATTAPTYTLLTAPTLTSSGTISVGSSVSASATDNAQGISDSESHTRAQAFDNLSAQVASGNAASQSSVTGAGVSATGAASGLNTSYSASASVGSNTPYYYYGTNYTIELSPESVLLVSATASSTAWAGNLSCGASSISCGVNSESANASATMGLNYNYSNGGASDNYSYSNSVSASAYYNPYSQYGYNPVTGSYGWLPSVTQAQTNSNVLTAVFTNSSSVTQSADLSLSATVSGIGNSMVPEVGTLPLFALGLLGVIGLKRKAQGQAQSA